MFSNIYSFVIMASTLISIPKFFEFTHIEIENGTTKYWTSELNENAVYVWAHQIKPRIYKSCFHQFSSPILRNTYLFWYLQLRKKSLFRPIRNVFSFSTEKNWRKIGENKIHWFVNWSDELVKGCIQQLLWMCCYWSYSFTSFMFSQLQYLSQHTSINKYYGSIKVCTYVYGSMKLTPWHPRPKS